jgi:signal peptidase I
MEPTIMKGDMVHVDYGAYRNRPPERWDVVVYKRDEKRLWIHRVVGLPGEEIRLERGGVFVNDKKLEAPQNLSHIPYVSKEVMIDPAAQPPFEIYQVPKDSYFLLGDNSKESADSRYLGAIHMDRIKGKVVLQ